MARDIKCEPYGIIIMLIWYIIMVFVWYYMVFAMGIRMVLLWFSCASFINSYVSQMHAFGFLWLPYGFPMDSLWLPEESLIFRMIP